MSKTDKDAPWNVRKVRGEITNNIANSSKSWRERGSGPKGVRFAKKEARRARRRGINHPWMVKSLHTTYKYNSG